MTKRGPKPLQIDWEEFDKLCMIQCTLEEIASWYDCSVDTIEIIVKREKKMKFSEYFAIKRGKGRVSLRRKQFQLAINGSVPLLIWLGKQYLGQVDKQEVGTAEAGEVKIEYVKKDN